MAGQFEFYIWLDARRHFCLIAAFFDDIYWAKQFVLMATIFRTAHMEKMA